jgi:hypothetical protein
VAEPIARGTSASWRTIVPVSLVLAVVAFGCTRDRNLKESVIPTPQLTCATPAQFTASMGHTQQLHNKSGAAVVNAARITPNGRLAGWKSATDFDAGPYGQLAAFICVTESYQKLGLVAGSGGNELWLRHTGTGDAASDWTAYIHPVGSKDYTSFTVFKRDTTDDAQLHPAGHAQWVDGDENIWVSCAHGCCYVGRGGGSGGDST